MKKLKLMANLAQGRCLDIGFAHNPNPFLKSPIGIDIQNVPKPKNYKEVHVLNLNTKKLLFQRILLTRYSLEMLSNISKIHHLS